MKILENKNNYTVLKDNVNNIIFFSYNDQIATYDKYNQRLWLGTLWDYSQTTLKQLKNFVNTYTCFNYENKKQFENEIENNENIIKLKKENYDENNLYTL